VKNKRERSSLLRPPGVEKTTRLGSRDPVASGVKCGPHGGKNSGTISLVHRNKYGFIKTRSIQDCLAWSFEYIHQCQQSKKEAIILKSDFKKAFDTVEHQSILAMLTHLGFPERWIVWVTNILNSGFSAILLNGVPRKFFKCKRGVR
jgi:hypothetical protein